MVFSCDVGTLGGVETCPWPPRPTMTLPELPQGIAQCPKIRCCWPFGSYGDDGQIYQRKVQIIRRFSRLLVLGVRVGIF